MEVMSKVCTKCKIEKLLTEFNNQKLGKYGKRATCRECQNAGNRLYKQTDKGIQLRREWKRSEVGRESSRRFRRNHKGEGKTYEYKGELKERVPYGKYERSEHTKECAKLYTRTEEYRIRHRISADKQRFGGNRIKALERDNYKCTICGSDYLLQVHHKDEMGRNKPKELRNNDMSNLITLCAKCHITQHNPVLKRWAKV